MKTGRSINNLNPQDNKKNKKICPLLQNCYEECYCSKLNSNTIESIIKFCGNNYFDCEIYKKIISSKSYNSDLSGSIKFS